MPIPEDQLKAWSRPLSTTEDQKCKNAVNAVTEVLRNHFGNSVSIFLQGSYRNNTNVRRDSDVDIVVRFDNSFFPDLQRLNYNQVQEYNRTVVLSDYKFENFKHDVHQILQVAFPREVERNNKCINVFGNSNRITADVVPCMKLKRFLDPINVEVEGIQFYCDDDNQKVISFPEQHYKYGVIKTEQTYRLYKRMVRILKHLRNILIDNGSIHCELVSSFFIESLIYNVPNEFFIDENYVQTLKNVLYYLYADLDNSSRTAQYVEVSRCLHLFPKGGRSPVDAKLFITKCRDYAGY